MRDPVSECREQEGKPLDVGLWPPLPHSRWMPTQRTHALAYTRTHTHIHISGGFVFQFCGNSYFSAHQTVRSLMDAWNCYHIQDKLETLQLSYGFWHYHLCFFPYPPRPEHTVFSGLYIAEVYCSNLAISTFMGSSKKGVRVKPEAAGFCQLQVYSLYRWHTGKCLTVDIQQFWVQVTFQKEDQGLQRGGRQSGCVWLRRMGFEGTGW